MDARMVRPASTASRTREVSHVGKCCPLIRYQRLTLSPKRMVCQRRIKSLNKRDNLPPADLEDVKVDLIVPVTGKRHAIVLCNSDDHFPRLSNDLVLGAKADLLGVHTAEYMREYTFKESVFATINPRQNIVLTRTNQTKILSNKSLQCRDMARSHRIIELINDFSHSTLLRRQRHWRLLDRLSAGISRLRAP